MFSLGLAFELSFMTMPMQHGYPFLVGLSARVTHWLERWLDARRIWCSSSLWLFRLLGLIQYDVLLWPKRGQRRGNWKHNGKATHWIFGRLMTLAAPTRHSQVPSKKPAETNGKRNHSRFISYNVQEKSTSVASLFPKAVACTSEGNLPKAEAKLWSETKAIPRQGCSFIAASCTWLSSCVQLSLFVSGFTVKAAYQVN